MKKRRLTALCMAAVLAAASLSGCGGSSSSSTGETTAKAAEGGASVDTSGESKIVIEIGNDPTNLQPSTINQQAVMEMRMNYYERLFEWDYNGDVAPLLAKEYEWVDDFHLKVTLHDNIVTHSGKKITSSDVKFSLEQAKNSAEFARHTTNIDYDHIEQRDTPLME